ncbi:hypothetical protein MMC18_000295 [Xylographa bjoerkii]|nr:hypothetical protein [Xylographa bjoerkii]
MTAVAGSLGSVIGYLGAEVAENNIFERLLWPQRFYNDFNASVLCKMVVFMPMGGPLHRAALETLDSFRDSGLYHGARRGNMLGTAYLCDLGVKHYLRTSGRSGDADEVRNGFWVEVLRHIDGGQGVIRPPPQSDTEAKRLGDRRPVRATPLLHHLVLRSVSEKERKDRDIIRVSENSVSWRSFAGIFASELSAIAVALVAGVQMRCLWLALYFCVPLMLKLLAVSVSVRRESLMPGQRPAPHKAQTSDIFEVDDLKNGFALIEGPVPVVQQFFRHYGHPLRNHGLMDRSRELATIALVYAFVFYFPTGLVSIMWTSEEVQYLWLGYQVYTIVAMHVLRLAGWGGCGRTEERVAKKL